MATHLQRVIVFTVTFISYAFYHASRKNLSGVKASLSHEWLDNTTHKVIHGLTVMNLVSRITHLLFFSLCSKISTVQTPSWVPSMPSSCCVTLSD